MMPLNRNKRFETERAGLAVALLLAVLIAGCVTTGAMREMSAQELEEAWRTSQERTRAAIVEELERREAVDALVGCLTRTGSGVMTRRTGFTKHDIVAILEALGRIGDPRALERVLYVNDMGDKEVKLALLEAYAGIGGERCGKAALQYLEDGAQEVRWQALHALETLGTGEHVVRVKPLLFDTDANIRWKAVHVLGTIGGDGVIGPLSLALADRDEQVRGLAENVLRRLGVAEERIAGWKSKAQKVSLDDVYQSKMAYQKAVVEKEALEEKLESEADVKRSLEASLKQQEEALKRQEDLVGSLYEKERQLKSKLFQLERAQGRARENTREMERLRDRSEALRKELEAKEERTPDAKREELAAVERERSELEQEARLLEEKRARLRSEVDTLRSTAEETRREAAEAEASLEEIQSREAALREQVEDLKERLDRGMAPVVVISSPESGVRVESGASVLHVIVVDDRGLKDLKITVNGRPVQLETERGLRVTGADGEEAPKKIDVAERLSLEEGENRITVTAVDTDGMTTEETVTVLRRKARGKIWAVVVGINDYRHTRDLKYAVNDARGFRDYLRDYLGVPDGRVFVLEDQEATRSRVQSLLGTELKRKASSEDTVIIFYAGHGAVEADPLDPDGDGFEKYLLPCDARLDDLYSTAIAMKEIYTIFQRIRAERLVFIADTCYSGASGGRSLLAANTRAALSERFFDRVSRGKGRVILSACSANEVSKEDDGLGHGLFSYYLLEGLKGEADQDADGIVTVSELFGYLSRKVPEASGQDQHPVRKGETQGELVIGRIR
jgi:hypothetical protein